ncbi:MAG: hypothetical protein IKN79_05265 [Eubacterium sp.]|nr:hypothetical protein [Eubacterium sp.]
MTDLSLKITRGDATLLYAVSRSSYTVRLYLRLDHMIDPVVMRKALDLTAKRYPYFSVRLKKNEKEFYYEENPAPIALINTDDKITLGSEETNGQVWAVCYNEDRLYIDFYHGRSDGTGIYPVLATLLYYYLSDKYGEMDSTGIRTLETPLSERETRDPVDALPVIDLNAVKIPPSPKALNLIETSGFKKMEGKGKIFKLMIPEESFLPFIKENDASPGIMLCVLMARAIERVHPDHQEPLMNSYVVNARPMLHSPETFHNCTNRVILHYDEKVRSMPLDRQCTVYRGKTILQSDEETIQKKMVVSGTVAQNVLNAPDLTAKVQMAGKWILNFFSSSTYTVSYVGKWKAEQIGKHVREFWTEIPTGAFPAIEVASANGKIFVSILQSFEERVYYEALLLEMRSKGIEFVECGDEPVKVADIVS